MPRLTVAFALVKGERPEWIVQKLTEVGVDSIRPFVAARSVVRWAPAKADSQVGRLRRVAREAAMQSRRCWLPEVAPLVPFAEVADLPGAVLADRDGVAVDAAATTVLVGPEGGWDDDERRGRATVALGDAVLRAETAAVAAGVLLTALRAGIVADAARSSAD
jgi:16S rRNA (uracil1498-N3)-methyltransferase